jgi:hypothetical protein
MPEKATVQRAKRDLRKGKSASSAAGEFVREEMHHVREGKHGARSAKQAIAIGLSKARRAGVPLGTPKKGRASTATRKAAKRDITAGQHRGAHHTSRKRSRAVESALRREPHRAASHRALASHATHAAKQRTHAERSASARKAARTRAREKSR